MKSELDLDKDTSRIHNLSGTKVNGLLLAAKEIE